MTYQTLLYHVLAVIAALITFLVLYSWRYISAQRPRKYRALKRVIRKAKSRGTLEALEDEVFQFEREYRGRMNVAPLFHELMADIRDRMAVLRKGQ